MLYTLRSDEKNIDWRVTGTDRILQNVLNIIRTKKYEVPFNRMFGINPDYIDNSIALHKAEIIGDVTQNISLYEPRANVVSVNVDSYDNDGNVLIVVEVEV